MKKKKVIALIGTLIVVGALGGAGYYYRSELMELIPFFQTARSDDKVYVEKLSRVMNTYTGVSNRYNGVVESQDSYKVTVDSSRTIDEILVQVGDTVEEGQALLTYDASDIEMQIKQANLELESINNEIDNYNKQIATLNEALGKTTDEDEKFSLTTDIQSLENSIEQSKIDLESKNLEISKYREQVEDSTLVSKQAGVVKEINESGMDASGNTAPFMTIMQTGEYRVKGSIDEQNVWMLTEGQEVLIRSRVDEAKTWRGTISKIDTENIQQDDEYASSYDSGTVSATKYPFYIALDSAEGLLLGQHVYIEMDEGQEEPKEGIWLYADYVVQDDTGAYVWAANDKNRLEKRYVELGEYNENLNEYEILSGLSEDDYITWPMTGLYEGVTTVTDASEVDYSSPLYNQESTEMPNEGMEDVYMEDTEWLYDEDTEWLYEEDTEWLFEEGDIEVRGAEAVFDTEVAE